MKERPILFSASMVRALLALFAGPKPTGKPKTKTRRVVNDRARRLLAAAALAGECRELDAPSPPTANDQAAWAQFCPYGVPGDRLWVREAFAFTDAHVPDYSGSIEYRADSKCLAVEAGRDLVDVPHGCDPRPFAGPWTPSIHMPRWASRITLEITGVRVERLQDISEADALAEGIDREAVAGYSRAGLDRPAAFAFRDLWISINGVDSWDANPWVWVVEFRRLEAAP